VSPPVWDVPSGNPSSRLPLAAAVQEQAAGYSVGTFMFTYATDRARARAILMRRPRSGGRNFIVSDRGDSDLIGRKECTRLASISVGIWLCIRTCSIQTLPALMFLAHRPVSDSVMTCYGPHGGDDPKAL